MKTAAPTQSHTGIRNFNMILLAVMCAALVVYVVAANSLASRQWRFSQSQSKLSALLEQRNTIADQQAALEDRGRLMELAIRSGMVGVGDVVYLVQEGAVAAR